jgi:hypothetical protein
MITSHIGETLVFYRESVKRLLLVAEVIIFLLVAGAYFFRTNSADAQTADTVMGVFQGITPCSGTDRPLPQIPVGANCEQMIWDMTFYQNTETGEPATYQLHATYGLSQPNTTGLTGGGTPINLEGDWRIVEGIAEDAAAIVYELNPDRPESTLYFVKLDDNLLHVLSSEKRLMVGNGGWSYTLNRTDKSSEAQPISLPVEPVTPPAVISTAGVFEGRMPCADLVVELTKFPADPACIKIKMRLTLNRDPNTGEPATYFLKGTETMREGTWTESLGTPAHPNGTVYRLSLDTPERFIAFLRLDDNHLFLLDENSHLMVGDALWSYTLSRNADLSAKMNP